MVIADNPPYSSNNPSSAIILTIIAANSWSSPTCSRLKLDVPLCMYKLTQFVNGKVFNICIDITTTVYYVHYCSSVGMVQTVSICWDIVFSQTLVVQKTSYFAFWGWLWWCDIAFATGPHEMLNAVWWRCHCGDETRQKHSDEQSWWQARHEDMQETMASFVSTKFLKGLTNLSQKGST